MKKEKTKLIQKIWNSYKKGKYVKINNKDGSMPTFKEFQKIILN